LKGESISITISHTHNHSIHNDNRKKSFAREASRGAYRGSAASDLSEVASTSGAHSEWQAVPPGRFRR